MATSSSSLQPCTWEAADSSTSLSSLEEQSMESSSLKNMNAASHSISNRKLVSTVESLHARQPKNFILRWMTKGEIGLSSNNSSLIAVADEHCDSTEERGHDTHRVAEFPTAGVTTLAASHANHETELAVPAVQEITLSNKEKEANATNTQPVLSLCTGATIAANATAEMEALPFSELEQYMNDEEWGEVCRLLELHPDLARRPVQLTLQGERTRALLLHKALHQEASLQVVDLLLTIHPQALLVPEDRQGLFPLHVAVMRGALLEVVVALVRARPVVLKLPDRHGNLPLHTAAQYSRDWSVLKFLLRACPAAATCPDAKGRVPLHLGAALGWGDEAETTQRIQSLMTTTGMAALQCRDTRGNLPIHTACNQPGPVWPVIRMLMQAYPAGLLVRNAAGQLPLACLMRFSTDESVIVGAVRDQTQEEQRKQRKNQPVTTPFEKFFRRRSRKTPTEWQPIYG